MKNYFRLARIDKSTTLHCPIPVQDLVGGWNILICCFKKDYLLDYGRLNDYHDQWWFSVMDCHSIAFDWGKENFLVQLMAVFMFKKDQWHIRKPTTINWLKKTMLPFWLLKHLKNHNNMNFKYSDLNMK